ncbi:phosphoribosylformimino-5-aminoimidazole carboxamide ribotide isomerase [Planctomycetaceae bacterium]|nr:phosphoribosylformimino-5-aminoimidazole carboxamide ribotide isomerase [Planctomycetaceae bacterium]
MTFTVYPAIDLRKGKVVRLQQGEASQVTVYSDDPVAVAQGFRNQGALWLHVVNLDGAFGESQRNYTKVGKILEKAHMLVQFGGGLRDASGILFAMAAGAARVVLGTVALRKPEVVAEAVKKYGADRIAVGIDARNGKVAIEGWVETTGVRADYLVKQMMELGVERFIYTDIARDGMMVGPDVEGGKRLCDLGAKVILSGGVGSLEHVKAAAESGAEGLIVGKALYEGRFTLIEALAFNRKQA